MANVSSIQVVSYSPITKIGSVFVGTTTQIEPEKQNELESITAEYGKDSGESISIDWKISRRVDDGFKFGDPFSGQLVHQVVPFLARGTAGCIITVRPIVGRDRT